MYDISVIIPVYKTEKFLEKCVSSVLKGGTQNIEILLIDDGSPDNSGVLCDKLSNEDPRIKVFHKENGGLSSARNLGIQKAQGKYLCFIDSDDYIEENALAYMLNKAETAFADIAIFGLIIDIEDREKYNVCEGNYILTQSNKNQHFKALKEKCLLDSCCNKLYLTEFVKSSGVLMPEGEFFEDTFFNLMLWQKFSCCAVFKDCYYHYLQRSLGSITKSFNPLKLDALKDRVRLMRDVTNSLEDFVNYFYIKYVLSFLCDSFLSGSGLSKSDRKNLIKKEIFDDKFKKSAANAHAISKSGKLLVLVAKSNSYFLTVLFLRVSCFVKYKLNNVFFRIKV